MMQKVVLAFSIIALVGCQQAEEPAEPAAPAPTAAATDSTDATVVAPDHYKVEFENDQVRVLRITYAEGDEAPMHSHPDGVVVFLGDQTGEFTLPDGSTREQPAKDGEAVWAGAESHAVKTLTGASALLVELKGGGGELATTDSDATTVAPDHYKAELENEKVRVVRITYAAGEETPMHSHPNGLVVILNDQSGEFTLPDGTTRQQDSKAGDVTWTDADSHASKALTEVSVLLIEPKGGAGE
jgi:quercetin dioxygenase-like cupin family protein